MSRTSLFRRQSWSVALLSLFIILVAGCSSPAPFVTVSTNSITFPAITQGSTSGPTPVTFTNSGRGTLRISSVIFGGANPSDFTNTSSCTGYIRPMGTCTIAVTFAPFGTAVGSLAETITVADNASGSPQVVSVSGTANVISLSVTPPASAIGTSGTLSFTAAGDPAGVKWSVLAAPFMGSTGMMTSPGTIDSSGNYTGPGGAQSFYATVTATSITNPAVSAYATINVVAPGVVTGTNNVQVAQYAVTPPSPANVGVEFGPTAAYGLNTWTQPNPQPGSPVDLYVAGMRQSMPYHMRGVIQFEDGSSFDDADYTFTTGALSAGQAPNMTFTTTAGMTPQSGIEMLDLVNGPVTVSPLVVTDLSGNILWSYNPELAGVQANPIKLLPNGHFLINFSIAAGTDGTNSVLQEVDLGGNVIWQMTAADLNTALAAATCNECNVTVIGTHHDFAVLPNGHIIVIASTQQTISGTLVTGDVIIDLGDMENVSGDNPTHAPRPVWAWNEFNHLDIDRQPYMYPDWTHTNAILYSSSDGNLIISMRHQNWLVKIDYDNGAGTGDIIWHLGYQGDFSLMNADGTPDTNATDWFFAQHGPSFTTTSTSGDFSLALFDNGDDRGVAVVAGGTCGVTGQPACYSTAPILQLDETAMTATLAFNPTTLNYSWFGGNTELLTNGDVEYDECATTDPAANAAIYEVTEAFTPQTVWQAIIAGQYAYRGFRMPSLYPGVQW